MSDSDIVEQTAGTALTRFNAVRHGILSRYTILPWEDADEYAVLLEALVTEHRPKGPTEEHLTEELAGVLWRKRRLRMAEASAFHRGLADASNDYRNTDKAALVHGKAGDAAENVGTAIRATPQDTEAELADLDDDEAMTRRALELLEAGGRGAYKAALAELREDTREWWAEMLEGGPDEDGTAFTADMASLRRFIEAEVMPWFERRRQELASRPLIRAQAFGEALDPHKLERLARYEVHLDRKLERTLAMLLKLQELRAGAG